MKNNGFTLIELLAVIVILAIVALIATPIILGIINDTKEESNERSMELYAEAVENAIVAYQLDRTSIPENFSDLNIEYDGDVECEESELYEDRSFYLGKCSINDSEPKYSYGEKQVAPVSFETDDWSTIVANLNSDVYKVGDTREISLTNFENLEKDENGNNIGTYTIRIANKSTPEECNTPGFSQTACGFVIESEDIILNSGDNAKMNLSNTNVGGWEASLMRTYVNNTIYESLPGDIRNSIIPTTVVSGHGKTSGEPNFITTDNVYLLSTAEIWEQGTSNKITNDTARDLTRQLDYYKNYKNTDGSIGVTTSKYSGAIKKYNGSAYMWWLRSANSNYTYNFYIVNGNGDWDYRTAFNAIGVAVAFRIG